MLTANSHYELMLIGRDFVFTNDLHLLLEQFTSVLWVVDVDDALPCHPTHLEVFVGNPHFLSEARLQIDSNQQSQTCSFDYVILAPGSQAYRPHWWIDHPAITLGGSAGDLQPETNSATVIGLGAEGTKLAHQLADQVDELHLIDADWDHALHPLALHGRVKKSSEHRGYEVIGLLPSKNSTIILLENGQQIPTQQVFVCCGQRGNTAFLNLAAAGIHADDRGQLWCNDQLETWAEQIYAVGSVVGYPEQPKSLKQQIQIVAQSISNQWAGQFAGQV